MPATTTQDTMLATEALQTLMSLPGWQRVAATYIGNPELLNDLFDDLSRATWEEIAA